MIWIRPERPILLPSYPRPSPRREFHPDALLLSRPPPTQGGMFGPYIPAPTVGETGGTGAITSGLYGVAGTPNAPSAASLSAVSASLLSVQDSEALYTLGCWFVSARLPTEEQVLTCLVLFPGWLQRWR